MVWRTNFIEQQEHLWTGCIFLFTSLFVGSHEARVITTMKNTKYCFWTIKNGNNTAFLIGSLHSMRKDMYPLSDKFEKAFSGSTIIVFEANMEEGANTNELKQYV